MNNLTVNNQEFYHTIEVVEYICEKCGYRQPRLLLTEAAHCNVCYAKWLCEKFPMREVKE